MMFSIGKEIEKAIKIKEDEIVRLRKALVALATCGEYKDPPSLPSFPILTGPRHQNG